MAVCRTAGALIVAASTRAAVSSFAAIGSGEHHAMAVRIALLVGIAVAIAIAEGGEYAAPIRAHRVSRALVVGRTRLPRNEYVWNTVRI